MKNLIIFGLFILCLVAAQATFAQTADDVVSKYIDALGGLKKMEDLKTMKSTGSMSVQGADVALVITRKHMVGVRTDISIMGTENYQIITPEKGWSYMPIQQQSSPEEISEEQHKASVSQLDIQGSLVNYKAKGSTIELAGKEKVGNVECYKLKATLKSGKVITYFIDASSYRLVKSSSIVNMQGEDQEIATEYSNYKQNKDGYWFAYTSSSPRGEINFDSHETNVPVDDSIFKAN